MIRILLALLVLWPLIADAQSRVRVFIWDHPEVEIGEVVTRFEVSIDGGAWVDVGLDAHEDADTPADHLTFMAPVPALTIGPHVMRVRGCNEALCSDPAELAFTLDVKPAPSVNVRLKG